ncbi:MAG TPA: 4Fe-4S dicluster domain-containing protein [Blastocatellia bacterium]|nr:4Fe-4S dicluster domain-containing protein [Blastocatellia bacterium]
MNSKEQKTDRGQVEIAEEECKGCGLCVEACPPHVMKLSERFNFRGYHPAMYLGHGCTGCGICFFACPEPGAITVLIQQSTPAAATASMSAAAGH